MCEVNSNTQESSSHLGCIVSAPGSAASPGPSRSSRLLSPGARKEKKSRLSSWFGSSENPPTRAQQEEEDRKMTQFIAQMRCEGLSDAEMAFHLSYLREIRPMNERKLGSMKKPINPVSRWFADMQQMIKDEFSLTQPYPEHEASLRHLTVSVSSGPSGPFYGALPPDMEDMTYEELAALEPVYVGAKSVNDLPCRKFDGTPLPGEQTDCPVCLTSFKKGEKLKSLPCVHFFHKECIDTWLSVGHNCPVCKTELA